jgi:shikimate dehydrogenase
VSAIAGLFTPDGKTRLYGVMGHPVQGSLSPAFQNAGFRALGLNAVYVAFPVQSDQLMEAVQGLMATGVAGFNVTVPHKVTIVPLLARVMPEAQAMGAVNTVRCEPSDAGVRLVGTNTDGIGFLRSLERDLDLHPRGKRFLILGAGGAARGIAHALLRADADTLWIANRTLAHAQELAAALKARYPRATVEALPLEDAPDVVPQVLVNTTTVGMGDGKSPVRLSQVRVEEAVADIVYSPAETPLLAEARTLGVKCTNGMGMLLYQGCAAFEFWTGHPAPVIPMREALLAALRARP